MIRMSASKAFNKTLDELSRTLRGFNGVPGVMERLAAIEIRQQEIEKRLNDLPTLANLDQFFEDLMHKLEKNGSDPKFVSWSWIRDKIVQPSFMLFVGWFLFVFIPDVLRGLEK